MFQYFILTQYNFKYLSIMKLIVLMLDKGKPTPDMFRRCRSVLLNTKSSDNTVRLFNWSE